MVVDLFKLVALVLAMLMSVCSRSDPTPDDREAMAAVRAAFPAYEIEFGHTFCVKAFARPGHEIDRG